MKANFRTFFQRALVVIAALLIIAAFIFGGTSRDPNLRIWNAVADDDSTGPDSLTPCASYIVKYSLQPITAENFDLAITYIQNMVPKAPGQPESLLIKDLPQGRYYIAVKAVDSAGNIAPLSNIVTWKIDRTAPKSITDLK